MNDFLRDNGDLQIKNGDLVLGDATQQHTVDIVSHWKGWNHFQPTTGVGIARYLNDTQSAVGLTQNIRTELERDGQVVEAVRLTNNNILIESKYDLPS